jgi:uncharacterized protein (TIGR02270 family)
MSAIDYRERPVIDAIVEQHAEEAAFLWVQRDRATDEPHFARRHLARWDERVEAHVDGLRVAGDRGWEIARAQLDQHRGPGEMFAAGVLALGASFADRIDEMAALAAQKSETLHGFFGAIGWSEPATIAATVRRWHDSADPIERLLLLVACSVHRTDPGPRLATLLRDADERVRRGCSASAHAARPRSKLLPKPTTCAAGSRSKPSCAAARWSARRNGCAASTATPRSAA